MLFCCPIAGHPQKTGAAAVATSSNNTQIPKTYGDFWKKPFSKKRSKKCRTVHRFSMALHHNAKIMCLKNAKTVFLSSPPTPPALRWPHFVVWGHCRAAPRPSGGPCGGLPCGGHCVVVGRCRVVFLFFFSCMYPPSFPSSFSFPLPPSPLLFVFLFPLPLFPAKRNPKPYVVNATRSPKPYVVNAKRSPKP